MALAGFKFSSQAETPNDFLARTFLFIAFVLGLLSFFVTINLVLKISTFEALAAEIFASTLLAMFLSRKRPSKKKSLNLDLAREVVLIVGLVCYGLFCLDKVHSNYTGQASSYLKPVFEAKNVNYPYPFFSDEWHAIALSKKSMLDGHMPFYYPYSSGELRFLNVQWIFHNFNTGIYQFFSLEPLTSHVHLGMSINIMIVIFCFLILRLVDITRVSAFFSSALVFHLAHASNFPTIWSYLPIHLGLLFFLASVLSFFSHQRMLGLFFGAIVFLAYPPLVLFLIPFFWASRKSVSSKDVLIFTAGSILIFVGFLFLNQSSGGVQATIQYLASRLVFLKPTPEIYDILNPFKLISIVAICLALIGLSDVRKSKPVFLVTLIFVSIFWVCYSLTPWRLIIDYPRVAFLGGLFVSLIAGFGLDRIGRNLSKYRIVRDLICVSYLIWYGVNYTQLNNGQNMNVELHDGSKRNLAVRPPANLILHPDDLRIAEKIGAAFLISDPWKSTVLATAAQVKPLFLKSGTISDLSPVKYDDFVKNICLNIKPYWRIRFFLYFHESIQVKCDGLVMMDTSAENFKLYFHEGRPN